MNRPITALLLCLGLAVSIDGYANPKAGLYRWYDESGTVQYSDRPPEGVEAELVTEYGGVLTGPGKKAAAATPAPKTTAGDTSPEPAKAEGLPEGQEMEVLPEKDPALCEQAKKNMEALKGARIRITEPDGTKRLLNEDERDTQKANAQKVIDLNC